MLRQAKKKSKKTGHEPAKKGVIIRYKIMSYSDFTALDAQNELHGMWQDKFEYNHSETNPNSRVDKEKWILQNTAPNPETNGYYSETWTFDGEMTIVHRMQMEDFLLLSFYGEGDTIVDFSCTFY